MYNVSVRFKIIGEEGESKWAAECLSLPEIRVGIDKPGASKDEAYKEILTKARKAIMAIAKRYLKEVKAQDQLKGLNLVKEGIRY